MSTVGLEIFNRLMRRQITSEGINYCFHSKGVVNTTSPVTPYLADSASLQYEGDWCASRADFSSTSLPSGGVFAFSCTSRIGPRTENSLSITETPGGTTSFSLGCMGAIGTAITWYYFVPTSAFTPSTHGLGLQVFTETGALAYDSGYPPLRIVDWRSVSEFDAGDTSNGWKRAIELGTYNYPTQKTYALMPAFAQVGATYGIYRGVRNFSGNDFYVYDKNAWPVLGSVNGSSINLGSFKAGITRTCIVFKTVGSSPSTLDGTWWSTSRWGVGIIDVTGL